MIERAAAGVIGAIVLAFLGGLVSPTFLMIYLAGGWILGTYAYDRFDVPKRQESFPPSAHLWFLAAHADGNLSDSELERIAGLLECLGISTKNRDQLRVCVDSARTSDNLVDLMRSVNSLPEAEQLISFYGMFCVLYADGRPNSVECTWANGLIPAASDPEIFRAAMSAFEEFSEFCPDPADAQESDLKELGLKMGASQSEIKAAYRQLATDYHPDRHAGVAESLMKLTEEKFKQVQAAYERLIGKGQTVVRPLFVLDRDDNAKAIENAVKGEVVCCWHCGQKNRLPEPNSFRKASCGACHGLLTLEEKFGFFIRAFRRGEFRSK